MVHLSPASDKSATADMLAAARYHDSRSQAPADHFGRKRSAPVQDPCDYWGGEACQWMTITLSRARRYQAVPEAGGTTGGTMASIRCGPGSA